MHIPFQVLLSDAPSYSLAQVSLLRDWFHVLGVPKETEKLHPPRSCRAEGITPFCKHCLLRGCCSTCAGIKHPACLCASRCMCPSAFIGNSHCKAKEEGRRRESELSCLPRCTEIWEETWQSITHSPVLYRNGAVSSPRGPLTPPAMLVTFCDSRPAATLSYVNTGTGLPNAAHIIRDQTRVGRQI